MDSINSTSAYSPVNYYNIPLTDVRPDQENTPVSGDSVNISYVPASKKNKKKKPVSWKSSGEVREHSETNGSLGKKSAPSVPAEVDGWQIVSSAINKAGGIDWAAQKNGTKEALAVLELFQKINATCTWGNFGATELNITVTVNKPLTEKDAEDALKRGNALASDPAKGGKITPGSIEEAAVALMAERYGVITAPAVREATGAAEIVDAEGKSWDVKSPLSPPPDAKWVFDVDHQVVKVRHDLGNNERVLLNLSKCNSEDTAKVIATMERELTADEKSLIAVLVNREAVKS